MVLLEEVNTLRQEEKMNGMTERLECTNLFQENYEGHFSYSQPGMKLAV